MPQALDPNKIMRTWHGTKCWDRDETTSLPTATIPNSYDQVKLKYQREFFRQCHVLETCHASQPFYNDWYSRWFARFPLCCAAASDRHEIQVPFFVPTQIIMLSSAVNVGPYTVTYSVTIRDRSLPLPRLIIEKEKKKIASKMQRNRLEN